MLRSSLILWLFFRNFGHAGTLELVGRRFVLTGQAIHEKKHDRSVYFNRHSTAFYFFSRPMTQPTSAPPAKASKGTQTRERILDAAQAIARREGLEGLTIGRIAERLDMSKSGVFAHFGSREELQIAVIDDYARTFIDTVLLPAIDLPRGLPRLTAMFDNWLNRIVFVEIPNGCVFVSGAVDFDDKEGPVRDRMVAVARAWQGELQTAVQQAIAAGHLRNDTDAGQLVFDLYGVMLSLHHDARLLRDPRAVGRARSGFERTIGFYADASAGARPRAVPVKLRQALANTPARRSRSIAATAAKV